MQDYNSIVNTQDCITILQAYIDGQNIEFSGDGGKSWGEVGKIAHGLHEWNFKGWVYRIK